VLLAAETAAARGVAALSRLVGAGAGMTIPGKLLSKLDPGAIDRLAARLPAGTAAVSATNGKTTTAAMAAEILRPRFRLAHNRSGANLVSGVASTLLAAEHAELGLFEVDEAALPEVLRRIRPRAVCLGNLFRDQLDRYGELELVAERWREAVRRLPRETELLVNGDDPPLGALADAHERSVVFGLDDPRLARPSLQHAADSKYCVRCGHPYDYAAVYVGHLGDYRCPNCGHARPPLDIVGRAVELHGLERAEFDLVTPEGTRRVVLALPGLYNVYNALAAATLSRALGASLDEIAAGLSRFVAAFGRFERIPVGSKRLLLLLVKNPAGANEAVRTLVDGGAPRVAVIALNDAIADGRDVSWIWDVDFELLLADLDTLVATGDRAAELALRFKYAGLDDSRIVVEPDLARALDRGLELTPDGDELVVLPTYTAMLALQRLLAERGLAKPYWERAA
jgi:UDP-N-acetylmuramyl tripeptide synthase